MNFLFKLFYKHKNLHSITVDYLLSKGSWVGVGNSWWCEIEGCKNPLSDILWFDGDIKYLLCAEHCKEYLSKRNRAMELKYYRKKNKK